MKGPTYYLRIASLDEIVEGLTWYDDAYHLAKSLSEQSGYTVEQCAGVIAATSINQSWGGNVTLAKAAILDGVYKGLRFVREKVKTILQCDGDKDCILKILRGDKVCAFFLNIIGDFSRVTVDRWMRRVLNRPTDRATGKAYTKDAAKLKELATKNGYKPAQFQAIVWVAYRNRN